MIIVKKNIFDIIFCPENIKNKSQSKLSFVNNVSLKETWTKTSISTMKNYVKTNRKEYFCFWMFNDINWFLNILIKHRFQFWIYQILVSIKNCENIFDPTNSETISQLNKIENWKYHKYSNEKIRNFKNICAFAGSINKLKKYCICVEHFFSAPQRTEQWKIFKQNGIDKISNSLRVFELYFLMQKSPQV